MRTGDGLGPNDPCHCGSEKKYKRCHQSSDLVARLAGADPAPKRRSAVVSGLRPVPAHIPPTDYYLTGKPAAGRAKAPILSSDEIIRMRRACAAAQQVLAVTCAAIRPGITTDAVDAVAHAAYIAAGGFPSTLNYHGFPKSVCTSVNEVICHGIPGDRILLDGDIVNVDVTIYLDGFHGDCNATVAVGKISAQDQALIDMARASMWAGIRAVRPGLPIHVIGRAIQDLAEPAGYGVVRAFVGHGIGRQFHQEPSVPHYHDPTARMIMMPGMTFTIEPMINAGHWEHRTLSDGWTAVTVDGKRSAQFEHTILVTDQGAQVLTLGPDEKPL